MPVGENRTFDNLFATFRPPPGQSVRNLLSLAIVNADGTPGPHFDRPLNAPAIGDLMSLFSFPK